MIIFPRGGNHKDDSQTLTRAGKETCRHDEMKISKKSRTAVKNGKISEIVRVGLTQMACTADPGKNLKKQLELLDQAAAAGAKILCTQELFRSQYFCQAEDHRFFKLAETIPGPSTDALAKVAKKHKAVIIGSLFEKRAAG